METWQKYILGTALLITAIGVIWTKVLKPTLDFYATSKQLVPLLKKMNEVFGGNPNAFSVLNDIAKQFTTDSGSSLKDQVNRLESAAERQEVAAQKAEANAEWLKIGVAAQKELGEDDRKQLRELLIKLGINAKAMEILTSAVDDIQKDARGVADDLAAAHKRADSVSDKPHGAAADAAAMLTEKEKSDFPIEA